MLGPLLRRCGRILAVSGLLTGVAGPDVGAREMDWQFTGEQGGVRVRLAPHSPEQMAAFYEARGFPKPAIEAIRKACFVTTGVENETDQILWIELDRWRFYTPEGPVRRLSRADWAARWQALGLPRSNRATFGWTLLPEARDLWPQEPVGGNITLVPPKGPFTLEAHFRLGPDKGRGERVVRIEGVRCAREEER